MPHGYLRLQIGENRLPDSVTGLEIWFFDV
jgi:hypothetical protein